MADMAKSYLQRALDGEAPVFLWTHTDGEGNEIPCEVRLVRLPSTEHAIVRGSITDITDRVHIEKRQKLMMRELDHRVKNNLATVLSLTEQSAADAQSVEELRRALASRIHAMADIHRALAEQQWTGMKIDELVQITLAPYRTGDAERLRMTGVPLTIGPEACSALSMVVHELATNAAKHGAFSEPAGRVELDWCTENDGIAIDWTESGGPPVQPPERRGYGTQLITGLIEHQLGGHVDTAYASDGLRCRIWIPREPRQDNTGPASLTS
jgi:two-component sensor histidine kinase